MGLNLFHRFGAIHLLAAGWALVKRQKWDRILLAAASPRNGLPHSPDLPASACWTRLQVNHGIILLAWTRPGNSMSQDPIRQPVFPSCRSERPEDSCSG